MEKLSAQTTSTIVRKNLLEPRLHLAAIANGDIPLTLLTALLLISGTVDTSNLEKSAVVMLMNRAEDAVAAASKGEILDTIGRLSAQAARRESIIAIAASLEDHKPALMGNGGRTIQCSSVDSGSSSSDVLRSHVETKAAHTIPHTPSSDVHPTAAAPPLTTPLNVPSPVASNRYAHAAATLSVPYDCTVAPRSSTDNLKTPVRAVNAATAWFTSKLMESVNSTASNPHSASSTSSVVIQSTDESGGNRSLPFTEAEPSYESFINAELATIAESNTADVEMQDSITSDSPSKPLGSAEPATISESIEANLEIQDSISLDEPSKQLLALAYGQQRMNLSTALELIAEKKPKSEQTRPYQERLQRRAQAIVAAASDRALALGIHNLKPELACREEILLIFSRLSSVHRRMCAGNIEKQKTDTMVVNTTEASVGNNDESGDVGCAAGSALTVDNFSWSDTKTHGNNNETLKSSTIDSESSSTFIGFSNADLKIRNSFIPGLGPTSLIAFANGEKQMTLLSALKFIAQSVPYNREKQPLWSDLKDKADAVIASASNRRIATAIGQLKPELSSRESIVSIIPARKAVQADEKRQIRKEHADQRKLLKLNAAKSLTVDDFAWSDTDEEVEQIESFVTKSIVTMEEEIMPNPIISKKRSPSHTCAEHVRLRFNLWFNRHWNPEKKRIAPFPGDFDFTYDEAVGYVVKAKRTMRTSGHVWLPGVRYAEEILASARDERVALVFGHLQFVGINDKMSTHPKMKFNSKKGYHERVNRDRAARKYWKSVRADQKCCNMLMRVNYCPECLFLDSLYSEFTTTPTPLRRYQRLWRRGERIPTRVVSGYDSDAFEYFQAESFTSIPNVTDRRIEEYNARFSLLGTAQTPDASTLLKQTVSLTKAIKLLVKGKIVLCICNHSTMLLRQRALQVLRLTGDTLLRNEITRFCGKDISDDYMEYRQSIGGVTKNYSNNLTIPAFTSRFAFWAGIGAPGSASEEKLFCEWWQKHGGTHCVGHNLRINSKDAVYNSDVASMQRRRRKPHKVTNMSTLDVPKGEVELNLAEAVLVATKLAPASLCRHPYWLAVVRSAEVLIAAAPRLQLSTAICNAEIKRPSTLSKSSYARSYFNRSRFAQQAPDNSAMSSIYYQRRLRRKYCVSKIYVSDSSDDETHTDAKREFDDVIDGHTLQPVGNDTLHVDGQVISSEAVSHEGLTSANNCCSAGAISAIATDNLSDFMCTPNAVSAAGDVVREISPQVALAPVATPVNTLPLPLPLPMPTQSLPVPLLPPLLSQNRAYPKPEMHREEPVNKERVLSGFLSTDQLSSTSWRPANLVESADTNDSLASLKALSESAMADAAAARAERQFLMNEIAFEKDLLKEARDEAEQELDNVRKAFMENRMELKRISVVPEKEKTHQHSVEIEQKQVEMLYLEAERRPKLTEKYNLRKSVEMKECLLQSELKMQKNLSSQVRQHEKFQNAHKQRTTELTLLRETRQIAYEADLAAKDLSIQQLQGEIARAIADSRANTYLHQNISKSQALLEAEDSTVSTQLTSLQGQFTEQLQRKARLESQLKQTWKDIYLEREAFASNVVEIAELHEDRHDLNAYFAWKEGQVRMATDKSNQEMQDLFDSFKT